MNNFSNGLAVIGAKGFVGSTMTKKFIGSESYTRENISQLQNSSAETIILAAAPSVKWKANKNPTEDFYAISKVFDSISSSKATECILISTIDVFPSGIDFTEIDLPVEEKVEGYGRNRIWLEKKIKENFQKYLIVRLPGLYGPGLKKNVLYDLLNKKKDILYPGYNNIFEWFDVRDVPELIIKSRKLNLSTINLASEPTLIGDLAIEVFDVPLPSDNSNALDYRMKSNYASKITNRDSPYFFDKIEIFKKINEWKLSEVQK